MLQSISNAMVRLHKDQFGRGPTRARTYDASPDLLVGVLEEILLPAERRMVQMGEAERVRDHRGAFQAATASEFRAAVEEVFQRRTHSFASGIDVHADVAYEIFSLEPRLDEELEAAAPR